MSVYLRGLFIVAILSGAAGSAAAASPKEIDAAIKKGTDALRARYTQKITINPANTNDGVGGPGITCLSGIAMLEAGVNIADPSLKNIIEAVRNAAYSQTKTYHVSLCLMFLDRLGDPADVPLIQILAVRLLAGQTALGGWHYDCITGVQPADEQFLRAIKPLNGPPRMHPDVEKYAGTLHPVNTTGVTHVHDDNSNSQFAILAVWLARKHGVRVDPALETIEKRYMTSQGQNGGWAYPGGAEGLGMLQTSSPSMFCAGLIGMATAIARREERRAKLEAPKKEEAPKQEAPDPKKSSDDPFFNPPATKPKIEPKKPAPKYAEDDRDRIVKAAFAGLGEIVAASARANQGALSLKNDRHGFHDLYFFWSLERACVIFGVEKLGGLDWYEAGATTLVAAQNADGTWSGKYPTEVTTSFAVLFLLRSNLARDLAGGIQRNTETTMRTPGGPNNNSTEKKTNPGTSNDSNPIGPAPYIPGATGSEAATMAAELVRASDKDWPAVLKKIRDAKVGGNFTEALVTAANRLDGERLKLTREALAERLTRMSAETLRAMAKSDEAELRRGAVLAMAMKDDKKHIPDLIEAILDSEEIVVRAARAGLRSLTEQDFGPPANATRGEKELSQDDWKKWWSKQKP